MAQFIFSPGTTVATQDAAPEVIAEVPKTPAVTAEVPDVNVKAKEIAEAIIREREERESAKVREAENSTWKTRAEKAEAEVLQFGKRKDNIILDAPSYLEEAGLDKSQMAAVAEMIMFHLVPDKAPADLRARAVEAQYKRDKQLAEQKDAKSKVEAETKAEQARNEEGQKQIVEYARGFASLAPTLTESEFPHSVKWFGSDHDEYAERLFAKANKMSVAAQKAKTQVDLSHKSVAAELEKEYADRAKRFGSAAPSTLVSQSAPLKQATSLPPVKLTEKKDTMDGILTDKERIDRAVMAAFGGR